MYPQKKGHLTIKEYLSKIKSLCDTLVAAGHPVFALKQNNIILAGLPIEYESIRVVASAMPVSLDLLAEMLIDYEAR